MVLRGSMVTEHDEIGAAGQIRICERLDVRRHIVDGNGFDVMGTQARPRAMYSCLNTLFHRGSSVDQGPA